MNIRKLFDELQLRFHMLGMHRLAAFLGRFGTVESYPQLRAINYDPMWSQVDGIDPDKDIAWPSTKLDIN